MARGRPRIKIDYKQVEQLAAMQCTDEEIAAVLGVERSTIKRRKKDDDEFCTAYKKGQERGNCTDVALLERLLGGQRVQCIVTSPPYAEQRKTTYGGIPADEYPTRCPWT